MTVINNLIEKLSTLSNIEIIIIVIIVIIIIIIPLLKFALSIGKRVVIGLLYAAFTFIILTQFFNFGNETVGIISFIAFLIGFGIGKIFPSRE